MKKLVNILMSALLMMSSGCAQTKWAGFDGNIKTYESYYPETSEYRAWEDDIIEMAVDYLTWEPYLVDDEMLMKQISFDGKFVSVEEFRNLYDENKHAAFLEGINALIPSLSKLTETEIHLELGRIVAVLNDCHSSVDVSYEELYPIQLECFVVDEGVEWRLVGLPAEDEDFLYGRLVSINDVEIEEICERMSHCISTENKYWTLNMLRYRLRLKELLDFIGVTQKEKKEADFVFEKEDGSVEVLTLSSVNVDEFLEMDMIEHGIYQTYEYLSESLTKNYWFEMDEENDLAYVRISSFHADENQSLFDMTEKLRKAINERSGVEKIIVDLRFNTGGYKLDGYDRLIQVLSQENVGTVAVLINEATASQSVLFVTLVKLYVEDVLLVGSPAAEGSWVLYRADELTSNGLISYHMGYNYIQVHPEESYDALMPDVVIYPTLEDYKAGIDTVLESVKGN